MKLELKHLAPYLPYGLKAVLRLREDSSLPIDDEDTVTVGCFEVAYLDSEYEEFKPILRPLSDLTNDIKEGKPLFFPSHQLIKHIENKRDIFNCDYNEIDYLIRNHFDVFGLIEKGLAININTI